MRGGWERGVETVLGDYLEALCVDELDAVADVLPALPVGRISLLQVGEHLEADDAAGMLSGVVSGPAAVVRLLSRVRLAETLAEALKLRRELAQRGIGDHAHGEWIGRDWLRVNRGGDPHSGVLEREQRLKQLRGELLRSEENARDMEAALAACRESLAQAERERDARRAASRARTASMPTCSGSSKASAPARRNPPCGASASKRRPRKSRANAGSAQERWRARAPNWIAAAWRWTRSIRVASVSKTSARSAAKPCRPHAPAGRRHSPPAATC